MNECKPLAAGSKRDNSTLNGAGPVNLNKRDSSTQSRLSRGRPVQVDPIKPTLKAPGTKRLKLKHDILLSSFSFNFNVRRYTEEPWPCTPATPRTKRIG